MIRTVIDAPVLSSVRHKHASGQIRHHQRALQHHGLILQLLRADVRSGKQAQTKHMLALVIGSSFTLPVEVAEACFTIDRDCIGSVEISHSKASPVRKRAWHISCPLRRWTGS